MDSKDTPIKEETVDSPAAGDEPTKATGGNLSKPAKSEGTGSGGEKKPSVKEAIEDEKDGSTATIPKDSTSVSALAPKGVGEGPKEEYGVVRSGHEADRITDLEKENKILREEISEWHSLVKSLQLKMQKLIAAVRQPPKYNCQCKGDCVLPTMPGRGSVCGCAVFEIPCDDECDCKGNCKNPHNLPKVKKLEDNKRGTSP